jgi:two-component system sensor histidine kinase/response regulator
MSQAAAGDAAVEPQAIADLRHDLRTPIGHILGYGEMVVDELRERGQADLIADVEKMRTAGDRLLAMVNERLSASALGMTASGPPEAGSETHVPLILPTPAAVQGHTEISVDEPGRMLVVDDNEQNRDVLARRLRKLGHAVTMAESGSEALSLLIQDDIDVVLLDIMMPDMDGYEVLATLKADTLLRRVPVIMISALDDMESIVRCIEMGAEDYLPKPFNPVLLRARVGSSLRQKRLRDRELHYTTELQQNYRRLQQLEQLRDDLTHMIVHDLRTPLTSLMSGVQTVPLVGDLNDVQQEMIDISVEGGQTLLGMINDLLDVEKMEQEAVPLDLQPLSASELISRAGAQVTLLARSNRLTLHEDAAPDLPIFQGDEDKLRRVLVNLLGNAVKFTPEGGTITLGAKLMPSGGMLRFTVTDTGEGIPQEAFERIFDKFGQVESRKRGRKMSTGLGLAFCKMAVEAHGGQIGVESELGRGSTFFFTVPVVGPVQRSA